MTDNEIIKAMECCHEYSDCGNCQYGIFRTKNGLCVDLLHKGVLNLVNRQKAEIDRLNRVHGVEVKRIYDNNASLMAYYRKEVIKEFAERLKESFLDLDVQINAGKRKTIPVDEYIKLSEWLLHEVAIQEIDNLVEEMTEEKENA